MLNLHCGKSLPLQDTPVKEQWVPRALLAFLAMTCRHEAGGSYLQSSNRCSWKSFFPRRKVTCQMLCGCVLLFSLPILCMWAIATTRFVAISRYGFSYVISWRSPYSVSNMSEIVTKLCQIDLKNDKYTGIQKIWICSLHYVQGVWKLRLVRCVWVSLKIGYP